MTQSKMSAKEDLRMELEQNKRQLEHLQHRNQRLDQRISYLEKGERRKRAHRLITRGAAIESLAPGLALLTEPHFYETMESVFSLPDVCTIVKSAESMYAPSECDP